jgi:hypothetical protein
MKRFKRLLVLMPILLLTSCLQPSVSSASSSATASSTGGQTSQTSATTSSSVPVSGPYRVDPKTSTASTLNIHSVTRSGSSFVSTVTKTLTKGSYYTTYEDVAAYWIGFGELPVNYVLATPSTKDTKKAKPTLYMAKPQDFGLPIADPLVICNSVPSL